MEGLLADLSYIRKGKYRPATTTPATAVSRSGYPPWILKRGGLESSGRRLISSIGKIKGLVFFFSFFQGKNIFKSFRFFVKNMIFLRFLEIFRFLTILTIFLIFGDFCGLF